MAKTVKTTTHKPIEQYEHKDKERLNNPPIGLVEEATEPTNSSKKQYQYDPHLDPQLSWAGKTEHTSFEVPTVSLHVHERIDPRRIIETVKKEEDTRHGVQASLFEETRKPLREAIEFYKHRENWSNRLVAGDSLLVMNSLLEKEGMAGKVQMLFFDPPYGIKYGSNFQPFVNKKDVKDGKDEDLTSEPEMLKAFRDTWELGIHSYLTYLRDRLLLAKELLHETGSVFVQISDENVHHVRELMDEIFGPENFLSNLVFQKTTSSTSNLLSNVSDYVLWYSKNNSSVKFRQLFKEKKLGDEGATAYNYLKSSNGDISQLTKEEKQNLFTISPESKVFTTSGLTSQSPGSRYDVEFKGKVYKAEPGYWKTDPDRMKVLIEKDRIFATSGSLRYIRYFDDFPCFPIHNIWTDVGGDTDKLYVVQTSQKVITRCLLMTTDPGDLVLDITCGSGTTAFVAENWGRRWITCDTSRIALTLAKQRLMTANFDYFQLAHSHEGVGSGFKYKTVPHITLKSIANNEPAPQETLYDQPLLDSKRSRVTGPFTVEAVPAPVAKSLEDFENETAHEADKSVARSGETLRQEEWRNELLRTGVRGKKGETMKFTRVEPLSGTRYLQADAETQGENPQRVVVCFGPEHAPLEQRTVEAALQEALKLIPKPEIILFCAFQFDPEARKDIEETNYPKLTLLEAQMNADLLTDDLKKKRSSNESFWLIGQPDVKHTVLADGKSQVEVLGFDYYNPKTGVVESGGKSDIAMWMLDHNYDGRSLFPSQIFFPMASAKEGWATLAKNLKAEIDEEKIEAYGGTVSLPFKPGRDVAVKIIDARGIESLKIIRL